jgi:hypothetical protein|tara:strand:- start:2546 stop:2791 length:246 start_codon:yes stop_codon:yes gene_type:complete
MASADWTAAAMIETLAMTGEFIAEDVRMALATRGIVPHPNAWGAFFNHAQLAGVIEATGEWKAMRSPRSHRRKTQVYRRPA